MYCMIWHRNKWHGLTGHGCAYNDSENNIFLILSLSYQSVEMFLVYGV